MLLLLLGCADLLTLAGTLDNLTNPMVVQAWYIGVEPLPDGMDLGDSAWAEGSSAQAMLAEASSLDQVEESPVGDAEVVLHIDGEPYELPADGEGSFASNSEQGLPWASESDVSLEIQRAGDHSLSLWSPSPPTLDVPDTLRVDSPLSISLEGQDYDNVMVTVVRLADGETTYDSLPTDITELYRLTHSAGSLDVEVPASAFREPGPYAVGVAGLVNADPDTYDGVNLALSAMTSGALQFAGVVVE